MNGTLAGWFVISLITFLWGMVMLDSEHQNIVTAGGLLIVFATAAFLQFVETTLFLTGGFMPISRAATKVKTAIKVQQQKQRQRRGRGRGRGR